MTLLGACGAPEPATEGSASPSESPTSPTGPPDAVRSLATLEQQYAARLSVAAVDTGSGQIITLRAHERFPYASTSKVLKAAFVLREASDAELHVPSARGATLTGLLEAAVRHSDNAAAN